MAWLCNITLLVAVCYGSISFGAASNHEGNDERNYFQFVIPKYHTTRQSGQTVTVYVRYAYIKKLAITQYPDYRALRKAVLHYMEPSKSLPAEIYWEIIATKMGRELMKQFPLDGVSIQLHVLDNPNPNSYEPGDHGPIFTIGNIASLDVHP